MENDPLTAPIEGATSSSLGGVQVDVVNAANGRIKRVIWPAGHRWSKDRKPLVGTEYCMHAHVGFLARGRLDRVFEDGCTYSFTAPQIVVLEPGHDTWVVGDEPAVLIQFDFERETTKLLGLSERHMHP